MLRIFFAFPRGSAGLGLLVLRLVLAVYLIGDGTGQTVSALRGASDAVLLEAFGLALISCGALVAVGFLTPLVQTVVAVVGLSVVGLQLWLVPFDSLAASAWHQPVLEAALAAGLALVGPGAYSIDARAFGRQELTILPRQRDALVSRASVAKSGNAVSL